MSYTEFMSQDKCQDSIYTLKQAHNLAQNKSVTSVCNQDVTACCTSVSVANPLPAVYFFRGPKQYKSPNIRTGLLRGSAKPPTCSAIISHKSGWQYEAL